MYFRNEQTWQKQLIKELAEKYGVDVRVVRQMVYYPFLFTNRKMANKQDGTPIRHRHLGVFLLKKRFEKHFNETKVVKNT